ncbi:MAG: DUF5615 family PIN-like protein [Chloroflexota bacterium]
MKFKIDENLPQDVTTLFQRYGYDTMSIHDQTMSGELDENIAVVCQDEDRVIVTLDTDFADIRTYPPQNYPGIIVLRLRQHDKPYVLSIIQRIITALGDTPIHRQLWLVDEKRIRIRE